MRIAALSAVVYLCLTALVGIDVLRHLNTHIASDPGDPLFTAAVLTWNANHVALTDEWWQFPIFHPTKDTLAFSEHLLGLSVIATPIHWFTGSSITAYNVTLLLTYPLCGLAMYGLVFWLTRSHAAAFLAGLAFLLAPVRASQLPHIHLLATFYTGLVLLSLHAFVDTGRRRWLVLLGTAWLLQCAVSGYLLLYGSVLVAGWIVWFVIAPRRWKALGAIAATLALASAPLIPILVRYWTVHARHGFSRGMSEAALFSADITSLFCAPTLLTFWGWLRVGCKPESDIFPGLMLVVVCGAGAWWQWHSSRTPPTTPDDHGTGENVAIRKIRRLLLGASAVFIIIAIVTTIVGSWRVDLGPLHVRSASFAKPLSIAFTLWIAAVLLLPGLRGAAQRASTTTFYVLAVVVTWVLSWGPEPEFFGKRIMFEAPFAWLMRVPGGNSVRVPARFWLLSVLCLAVLMALLVSELLKRRTRALTAAVVVVASCGLIADGWAWIPVYAVPAMAPRADLLRGGIVLELPAGETIRDIAAVYRAVSGGWQTVNGYSGYEPVEYQQLREASAAGKVAFEPLLARGTLHVLVSKDAIELNRTVAGYRGSQLVGESEGLMQYRIEGGQ